jgi:hypothetical protein
MPTQRRSSVRLSSLRLSYKQPMRSFKASLKTDQTLRQELRQYSRHKHESEAYLEIFDALQEFLEAKNDDIRKYITIYLFMTYIEEGCYRQVRLPEDISKSYRDLIDEIEFDNEFFPVEHVRLLMLQVEKEVLDHLLYYQESIWIDANSVHTRSHESLISKGIKAIRNRLYRNKFKNFVIFE